MDTVQNVVLKNLDNGMYFELPGKVHTRVNGPGNYTIQYDVQVPA